MKLNPYDPPNDNEPRKAFDWGNYWAHIMAVCLLVLLWYAIFLTCFKFAFLIWGPN